MRFSASLSKAAERPVPMEDGAKNLEGLGSVIATFEDKLRASLAGRSDSGSCCFGAGVLGSKAFEETESNSVFFVDSVANFSWRW